MIQYIKDKKDNKHRNIEKSSIYIPYTLHMAKCRKGDKESILKLISISFCHPQIFFVGTRAFDWHPVQHCISHQKETKERKNRICFFHPYTTAYGNLASFFLAIFIIVQSERARNTVKKKK